MDAEIVLPGKTEELFGKSKTKMGRPTNPETDRYAQMYAQLWALAVVRTEPTDTDAAAARQVLGDQYEVACSILHGAEVPDPTLRDAPPDRIWQPLPDDLSARDRCYVAAALAEHLWGSTPRPPRSEISARVAAMGVPMPPPGPIPRRIYVLLGLALPVRPLTAHQKTGLAACDEAWIEREGKRLTKGRPHSRGPVRQPAHGALWPGDPTFESATKGL